MAVFLAATLCGILLSSAHLLARSNNPETYWYQPHYMAHVQDAGNLLQFMAPHFSSFFSVPLRTGSISITLDKYDANSLGINFFFDVSGVTEKDGPGLLSLSTVKVPYQKQELVSVVYADISSFQIMNFGDASSWCAAMLNRQSGYTLLCVPTRENAQQLIDALATLMVANGNLPGLGPGMTIAPISEKELRKHPDRPQCEVSGVSLDGPAAAAGIEASDIVQTVNGAVCTRDALNGAVAAAGNKPGGDVLHLAVLHKKSPLLIDVRYRPVPVDAAALRQQMNGPPRQHEPPPGLLPTPAAAAPAFHLGISARTVTDSDLASTGLSKPQGVIVTHVEKGSLADQMQLQMGDVIQKVNGAEVAGASTIAQLIRSGAARTVRVWRNGKTLDLTIPESM